MNSAKMLPPQTPATNSKLARPATAAVAATPVQPPATIACIPPATPIHHATSVQPPPTPSTATASSSAPASSNIQVCVRIRPMNQMELSTAQQVAWTTDALPGTVEARTVVPATPVAATAPVSSTPLFSSARKTKQQQTFEFDTVFPPEANNAAVFEVVAPSLISNLMSGYHSTVFAYGQTSSGKTHTIMGNPGTEEEGLLGRCIQATFQSISEHTHHEFVIRCSYLEVYNEVINDLLQSNTTGVGLNIREDRKRGIFVENLREEVVKDYDSVMALVHYGNHHRKTNKTNYNERSSRSHSIFRLVVESRERTSTSTVRSSVLHLVDLAGSENVIKAGSNDRAKETGFINKSLLTLSLIIQKLSERKSIEDTPHLPFRDSQLTRILQSNLSGNALITIMCTISPSSANSEESLNTLNFAKRAKKVRHKAPSIHQITDESALLTQYRMEIDRLKHELKRQIELNATLQRNGGNSQSASVTQQNEQSQLIARIEQLESLILTSDDMVMPPASRQNGTIASPVSALHSWKATQRLTPPASSSGTTNLAALANSKQSPSATLKTPLLISPSRRGSFASTAELTAMAQAAAAPAPLRSLDTIPDETFTKLCALSQAELIARILQFEESNARLTSANTALTKQMTKQEQALTEWQQFYATVKNRQEAFQTRLREVIGPLVASANAAAKQKENTVTTEASVSDLVFATPAKPLSSRSLNMATATAGRVAASLSPSRQVGTSTGSAHSAEQTNDGPNKTLSGATNDGLIDLEADGEQLVNEINDLFQSYHIVGGEAN